MLSGIDSPHELSEVLEQNLIKEMVPLSKRESLQKRIENQLTPAEPDPDEPMAENSKQLLESQLLSEVDPGNLIQIIQKMERNHFPIRGKWRIGNSTWEKAMRGCARLKNSSFHYSLTLVFLSKVEQLNSLDQIDHSVKPWLNIILCFFVFSTCFNRSFYKGSDNFMNEAMSRDYSDNFQTHHVIAPPSDVFFTMIGTPLCFYFEPSEVIACIITRS